MEEQAHFLKSGEEDHQGLLCAHTYITGVRATPEQRELYKSALRRALFAGNKVLKDGGNAMDAGVAAVSCMEDCPLFNSAKGAVFNVAGKVRVFLLSRHCSYQPHAD
jgi:isoaspartyl peptidase/L-asparaginase-like protein (Ntn-hydrolase superfamily)